MRAGEEIVSASAGAPPLQLIEAPGERLAHAYAREGVPSFQSGG
jgi:hypothetical protein